MVTNSIFQDPYIFLSIPPVLIESLTMPKLISNSLTFPGLADHLITLHLGVHYKCFICTRTTPGTGPTIRSYRGWRWLCGWRGSSTGRIKEKERKSIYIAPFCTTVHTKRSGMDHTVLPANNTMPAFPSCRSPDGTTTATEAADIQLQITTHSSTPKGWKAELA